VGDEEERVIRGNSKKAVMSLYEGAKTRVRVEPGLSEEFPVEVGVHQGSMLSPLLFAILVDVVKKCARKGLVYEILFADDLVLTSESWKNCKKNSENGKKHLKVRE